MSLKLNRASVPAELQEDVEKIALGRFPGSTVTWVDGNPGFIVLEIPEADYGSSHDIDAYGLALDQPESADEAVYASLEEELKRFVRSRRGI